MTHPIDLRMKYDPGSEFWVSFDEAFMVYCKRLLILKLPGWDSSSGIRREIEFFRARGIEPEWLEPGQLGINPEGSDFRAAFA
jgi:Domain of unknown function (DUF1937)